MRRGGDRSAYRIAAPARTRGASVKVTALPGGASSAKGISRVMPRADFPSAAPSRGNSSVCRAMRPTRTSKEGSAL